VGGTEHTNRLRWECVVPQWWSESSPYQATWGGGTAVRWGSRAAADIRLVTPYGCGGCGSGRAGWRLVGCPLRSPSPFPVLESTPGAPRSAIPQCWPFASPRRAPQTPLSFLKAFVMSQRKNSEDSPEPCEGSFLPLSSPGTQCGRRGSGGRVPAHWRVLAESRSSIPSAVGEVE